MNARHVMHQSLRPLRTDLVVEVPVHGELGLGLVAQEGVLQHRVVDVHAAHLKKKAIGSSV